MIDLYTFAAPNGRRVSILLEELNLPYRVHSVDLRAGEQNLPDFTAINPLGTIPVIVDNRPGQNGFVLTQSAAILLYLSEGSYLLPVDIKSRAAVFEAFMLVMTDVAASAVAGFLVERDAPSCERADIFTARLAKFLSVLDVKLQRDAYLAGDLSVADFALFPIMSLPVTLRALEQMSIYDGLAGWMARMTARASVVRGMVVG